MTSIDRTAYPKFKQFPNPKELAELYTPTAAEIKFVKSKTKSHEGLLRLMLMLKSFQRLGYFPQPELIPIAVIKHLRSCLKLQDSIKATPSERQRHTYKNIIREYLGVKQYDKTSQRLIATIVAQAAQIKDHPADLINVAIEELVKERYELPAFSTLDRLIRHIRSMVNNRLFALCSQGLSINEQIYLDQLLVVTNKEDEDDENATLNLLKSPPKSAKLSGIKLLQKLDEIAAYNTNNYLPLMWRFYAANRKALFSLVRSLDILSTSADESVIEALKFVLDNEHKRAKYLPCDIDLDFISNNWRTLVVAEIDGNDVLALDVVT
jgi:hypothetical protein